MTASTSPRTVSGDDSFTVGYSARDLDDRGRAGRVMARLVARSDRLYTQSRDADHIYIERFLAATDGTVHLFLGS